MCFVRVSFCVKNLLSVLLATVHLRQGWIYNDDKMSLTVSLSLLFNMKESQVPIVVLLPVVSLCVHLFALMLRYQLLTTAGWLDG